MTCVIINTNVLLAALILPHGPLPSDEGSGLETASQQRMILVYNR